MAMTVAVTGAEGFIGSHLVELLVAEGHRVKAMVQYNAFGSAGWLDGLDAEVLAGVEVRAGDVRDAASTTALLQGADAVCHLAALIGIPYSYVAPGSYVQTNVVGTFNVLESARALGTPRVVCTSTSEVYGTARTVPITEDHPLQAQSPYSASKAGADKLAESYHLSFGLPVVTLRPFNAYGPRQSARAVIPTVVTQLAAGGRVVRLGSLAPTRDLTFVTDTARAFLAVVTAPEEAVVGRVLNAGSGREIAVGDLVRLIGEVMECPVEVVRDEQRVRPAASEVLRLVSDSSALRGATGWAPRVDLRQGLAATAAWFRDQRNLARYHSDRYTL